MCTFVTEMPFFLKTDIRFKNINKLAIPALIAGIAEPLLSITDTAIIGNIDTNATESLAAVGIVGAFISMLVWVFGQVRSAISSIISQYVGAHKLKEVNDLPAQATAIVLLGSLVVLAISYPFPDKFLSFTMPREPSWTLLSVILKFEFLDFPSPCLFLLFLGLLEGCKTPITQ